MSQVRLKQLAQEAAINTQMIVWDSSLGIWRPGDQSIALWTASVRYYAVDYDAGSDSNVGYSDTSMADAGTKAFKTLEQLNSVFPKHGNNRRAVIAIKARAAGATYRNKLNTADDQLDCLANVYGYRQVLVRGTATVATAGATAFANDAADKVCCGSQIVSGTNATGYNPTGVPTNNTFDCQLNGGGAPGLSAEPALLGKRIRFKSDTTTVALRNACAMIWQNDTDTITTSTNLPAVPVAADIFYIEEPGVAIDTMTVSSSNATAHAYPTSFVSQGIQIAGLRFVTSTTGPALRISGAAALVVCTFIESPSSVSYSAIVVNGVTDARFGTTYTDEQVPPVTITPGTCGRIIGGLTASSCTNLSIASFAALLRFQILQIGSFSIGGGCYTVQGTLLQGCFGQTPTTVTGGVLIGNAGSATVRRYRNVGAFGSDVINISRSNCVLYGCDFTNAGAVPLIRVNGVGFGISIHDVVGSTGNTGDGLEVLLSRHGSYVLGTLAPNTFTGATGRDIRGAGPVFYVHADYGRCDLTDANKNHMQGNGVSDIGPNSIVTNDGNANIGQYAVVRATGSGVVRAARADIAANAAGVMGVCQSAFTAAGPQNSMAVDGGGTWLQFDAGPTAGNIAYLSTATAGNAQDTVPALAGTNQKLRLGRIVRVSGTLGFVSWTPEVLSVTADGLA